MTRDEQVAAIIARAAAGGRAPRVAAEARRNKPAPRAEIHAARTEAAVGAVAAALDRRRATMESFRRSFRVALSERPVSDSAPLATLYPAAPHMLDALDSHVETLPEYHPLKEAWRHVVQFERPHPDIRAIFIDQLMVSDTWVDELFERAQEVEWP